MKGHVTLASHLIAPRKLCTTRKFGIGFIEWINERNFMSVPLHIQHKVNIQLTTNTRIMEGSRRNNFSCTAVIAQLITKTT